VPLRTARRKATTADLRKSCSGTIARLVGLPLLPGTVPAFPLEMRGPPGPSGRLVRADQRTTSPLHSLSFHGVDLIALQTPKLGSACPIGHCHSELVALWAAVFLHGILQCSGDI
jgi:hypothetical protein